MNPETEIFEEEPIKDERGLFKKAIVLWQERPDKAKLTKAKLVEEGYDPEAIEVVYAIKRIFILQDQLDRAKADSTTVHESTTRIFEDLTECQFLITHYLLSRTSKQDVLIDFWKIFKLGTSDAREAASRHRGLISQVAAHKILQKLDLKPNLATPKQDAFSAIDMWDGDEDAFQVTSASEPALLSVDHAALVSSSVNQGAGEARFSPSDAYLESKGRKFGIKLRHLQQPGRPAIRGHMMVLPHGSLDNTTGEPSEALIDFYRQKLVK